MPPHSPGTDDGTFYIAVTEHSFQMVYILISTWCQGPDAVAYIDSTAVTDPTYML